MDNSYDIIERQKIVLLFAEEDVAYMDYQSKSLKKNTKAEILLDLKKIPFLLTLKYIYVL